jgi:fengycin family lipopeptide synthetase D
MSTENIIKDIYPLTPIQEGILYTYLLQKDSSAYFIQFEVVISNDLNIKCLEKSLNLIVEKYDVLRTNIVYTNIKKPKQVILREKQVNINYQDISDLTPDSIKSYIDDYKKEDKKRGFNITNENLTRMSVFKIAPQKFTIIWSFHHIIVDGWSGTKILVDFFDIYKLISQNHEYNHDSGKPNSYKDYVKWLTSQDKNTALAYWADYLKDYDTPIDIPKVLQGINCQKQFELQEYMIKIDEDTTNKLVKIASGNNVTLNALLQTIWGLLLQRYNNTDDVVFGYVESVRPTNIDGIEDMVGVFMNTIPFRVKCEEDDIFIDLLKTTQRKILNSNKYGFTSLAEIQENSYLKNNLINHISVFQNYPSMQKIINPELFDLNIEKMNMFSHSNYDFAVTFVPGNKFGIMFKYNTAVYREADIKRIGDHLINTIDSIIKNPSIKVSDIDILSNEEKDLLINGLNNTKADYPKDKTICELFEEQVRLNPDSIAVQFGETELSYKQLNEKANQLGNYLKEKYQIKPDDLVGIMLNASEQVIIAILGILKSGGAYVPIDPDYPSERIQYILEDSNVKLIICNDETQNKLSHENVSLVNMADINQLSQNTNNVLLSSKPKDMVYVIYTSGSTGKPKG